MKFESTQKWCGNVRGGYSLKPHDYMITIFKDGRANAHNVAELIGEVIREKFFDDIGKSFLTSEIIAVAVDVNKVFVIIRDGRQFCLSVKEVTP